MDYKLPIMSEVFAKGEKPEYLFWVGCAGAFDDRYKKVARSFTKILNYLEIDFAVLGTEETCTGDPARRAGNEMLYQMQALTNIATFSKYEIKNIITICPHCYNIFKNDYPDLGGNYNVTHYTQLLERYIDKLKISSEMYKNSTITFHDPCYLGRANNVYKTPRKSLELIESKKVELDRTKSKSFCCGAGGAQMFKEAEQGQKEIFIERTEEIIASGANIVATSCPFCMAMITDGIKYKNKEEDVTNLDIAELISNALNL